MVNMIVEKVDRVINVLDSVILDLESNDFRFTNTRKHSMKDITLAKSVIRQNPQTDEEMSNIFAL